MNRRLLFGLIGCAVLAAGLISCLGLAGVVTYFSASSVRDDRVAPTAAPTTGVVRPTIPATRTPNPVSTPVRSLEPTARTATPRPVVSDRLVTSTPTSGRRTPTSTAGNPVSDDADLDVFIEETVAALNRYWAMSFRQLGRAYAPPRFVNAEVNRRIRSRCGNSRGADHSYCPSENTVYADYDSDDSISFASLWDDERPLVIVATLGHEWGHHVQNVLGIFDDDSGSAADSRRFELQADCLMGVFIQAYSLTADWVARSDIRDVIRDTRESGDDPDSPADEQDHGTSQERVNAFQLGYQGADIRACGI